MTGTECEEEEVSSHTFWMSWNLGLRDKSTQSRHQNTSKRHKTLLWPIKLSENIRHPGLKCYLGLLTSVFKHDNASWARLYSHFGHSIYKKQNNGIKSDREEGSPPSFKETHFTWFEYWLTMTRCILKRVSTLFFFPHLNIYLMSTFMDFLDYIFIF